ncbi:MAG: hypothetical protein FWG21_04760 [Oscillospiraceae bacterium]|jgi:hypothetical protein|nr:hypothetical protein [Oscillospiraceae bacterium]
MKVVKDQIIDKTLDTIRLNVEDNYNTLESLYDNNGINIDKLEEQMGKLRRSNDEAIEHMYNEVVNSLPEKALLRKKKHNSEV